MIPPKLCETVVIKSMNTTAEMESAGKYIYEKGIIFDNLDQILFLTIFLHSGGDNDTTNRTNFNPVTLKEFDTYPGFIILNIIHT